MQKPKFIMIHHTAVSYQLNHDQFIANNRYHQQKFNFKSSLGYYLGYHYEINKHGKIYQARADGEAAAACYQSNKNNGETIHIALDGNFDIEQPFALEVYALRDLLRRLVGKYKLPKENILFHRQFANKSCPGKNMDLNFVRNLAQ